MSPPRDPENRARPAIALLIVAVLAIAALYLIQKLRQGANVEDCILSGRHDCTPLDLQRR